MTRHPRLFAGACLLVGVTAVFSQSQPPKEGKGKTRPGEFNAPPAKGERYQDTLKVGAAAPDFTLTDPSGKKQATLSTFQGKKPVVLIFGSCT